MHFRSDLWSSLAVLVGLAGVYFGMPWADPAALVVAVLVCIAGWRLGKRTVDSLTDVAPAGSSQKITAIAQRIAGVVEVRQVRARGAGDRTFVELTVAVSRTLPLDRVDYLKAELADAIRKRMPEAEVTVLTEAVRSTVSRCWNA